MSTNFPAIDLLVAYKNELKDNMNCYGCNLSETATLYDVKNKISSINTFAFMCNELIDCVTVPSNVTFLRPYLFYNKASQTTFAKIKKFVAPYPLTILYEMCFYSNAYLEEIVFQSVNEIRSYAFTSCTALKELPMISNLKIIENYAFDACRAMTKISLPNTLESVGTGVFRGCTAVNTVVLEQNFACSIDLSPTNLTAESIHNIAVSLKDLTGTGLTKSIVLGVANTATAVASDLALIQNKLWTVS